MAGFLDFSKSKKNVRMGISCIGKIKTWYHYRFLLLKILKDGMAGFLDFSKSKKNVRMGISYMENIKIWYC